MVRVGLIRKDYPTTGVLKLSYSPASCPFRHNYQEGLPDYWGIETNLVGAIYETRQYVQQDQEGLPDYWGIETLIHLGELVLRVLILSGRITRLLGY